MTKEVVYCCKSISTLLMTMTYQSRRENMTITNQKCTQEGGWYGWEQLRLTQSPLWIISSPPEMQSHEIERCDGPTVKYFSVVWKHTRNISCEVFSPYPDSRTGYISWCSNSCHSHATTNFLVACSHNDILEMIQDFIKDNNKTIKMSMPINFSFLNQQMMDFLNSNILFFYFVETQNAWTISTFHLLD